MKKGWIWPLIIVAFLLADMTAMGITVVLSNSDPSHHVIPDYYQRAVHYDATMDKERTLAELGWRLELRAVEPREGETAVTLALLDKAGQRVAGATGLVQVYHQARAAAAVRVPLKALSGGDYRVVVPIRRAGLWVFDADIEHPQGDVTIHLQRDIGL